ncbi:MAG: prepilin-type N-terminal cleavage/methylation domain-containing protein [Deltaproteobacteria bacterium]|jgi:prepilin-type N-terminal cleavage/methylation domain-containing protein|nr:prepilin-type N-terminal cleavage/methylation domain-containing protein [Deltaproteobacteria bacterium]
MKSAAQHVAELVPRFAESSFSRDKTPSADSRSSPGFSLIELVVVIGMIAILFALAAPNFKAIVPSARTNADAQKLASLMRKARTKAANTQKPVRLSVNCIEHFNSKKKVPCRAKIEIAEFSEGKLANWIPLPGPPADLHANVSVKAVNDSFAPVNGSRLDEHLVWLVFTPSSRIMSSFGPPINLSVRHGKMTHGGMLLSLNAVSGRVALSKQS